MRDDRGRYLGTPTLVIEVLSEAIWNMDMVKKLNLYLNSGVGEYWIVNPWNREFYVYSFVEGKIRNYRVFKEGEIASEVLEGLRVCLVEVFRE